MNVISCYGRASLFIFPKHTREDGSANLSVMYITDRSPQNGAQYTTRTGGKANSGKPLATRMSPVTRRSLYQFRDSRSPDGVCFHAYYADLGHRTDFKRSAAVGWGRGQNSH